MEFKTVLISEVKFTEFEEFDSGKHYSPEHGGADYPPLPTPTYLIDGVPYWDRKALISFGVAVEKSMVMPKPKG